MTDTLRPGLARTILCRTTARRDPRPVRTYVIGVPGLTVVESAVGWQIVHTRSGNALPGVHPGPEAAAAFAEQAGRLGDWTRNVGALAADGVFTDGLHRLLVDRGIAVVIPDGNDPQDDDLNPA